jgi:hypothetical protein
MVNGIARRPVLIGMAAVSELGDGQLGHGAQPAGATPSV